LFGASSVGFPPHNVVVSGVADVLRFTPRSPQLTVSQLANESAMMARSSSSFMPGKPRSLNV
jgi:hypothetical protein